MVWLGFAFVIGILGLEISTGIAVFGFTGGKAFVDREDSPGKFWFSIALQVLFGLLLPGLLILYVDVIW